MTAPEPPKPAETLEQIAERAAEQINTLAAKRYSIATTAMVILAALREVEARGEQRAAALGGAPMSPEALEMAVNDDVDVEEEKCEFLDRWVGTLEKKPGPRREAERGLDLVIAAVRVEAQKPEHPRTSTAPVNDAFGPEPYVTMLEAGPMSELNGPLEARMNDFLLDGTLRIFIGYDPTETIAYHVLAHSILTRASAPVSITPVAKHHLAGIYTRPRAANESTDFSLTRFLVPYLSDYEGVSIFMDCDMLCLTDIYELVEEAQAQPCYCGPTGHIVAHTHPAQDRAVWCVKHDYTPKSASKFLGHQQAVYRCKNWSSLMVFNNAACRALTPEYVNTATGLQLHQFFWLGKDGEGKIGGLDPAWNHLVGEMPPNPDAKLIHYTLGGPWHASGVEPQREWGLWNREYGMLAIEGGPIEWEMR